MVTGWWWAPAGLVEAVADPLSLFRWSLIGQEQSFDPDDEVVRKRGDLQPEMVVLERTERQVAQPRVFSLRM